MPLQRAQVLKMQFGNDMDFALKWQGAVETMAFTKKNTPQCVRGVSDYEFIFLQLM